MSAEEHLQAVGEIYAAFGRGDVPSILARLADDVAWESFEHNHAQAAGVPWLQRHDDPESVAEFFRIVGDWDFHSFELVDLMASENQVIAEVEVDVTIPGAERFREEELHMWTFGPDGKVTRFRHYVDTAKHIAAAGVAVPAA
jgi:ketosteroid isomerase-like protein